MAKGLTAKQQMFVKEYLVDLNATQAAIRAGYSEKTANVIGMENLTKPYIAEAVQEAMKGRSERTEVTADRVLQEYAKLAFVDIGTCFDSNGVLKSITEIPEDSRAALTGINVTEKFDKDAGPSKITKIKMVDKKGALDSIARHLGMFNDKLNVGTDQPISLKIEFEEPTASDAE